MPRRTSVAAKSPSHKNKVATQEEEKGIVAVATCMDANANAENAATTTVTTKMVKTTTAKTRKKPATTKHSKTTTTGGSGKENTQNEVLLHCVRCHESYHAKTNLKSKKLCIVEHNTEDFDGCRAGGQWYRGRLGCCGASYKYHRHYSEEKATPKYCFHGQHTTNPKDVQYNGTTIHTCYPDKCGEELFRTTEAEYQRQLEDKEKEETKKKNEAQQTKGQKRGGGADGRKRKHTPVNVFACDSSLEPPEGLLFEYYDDDSDDSYY